MSDGDYGATPDPPRSPGADDASLTRTRSPAPRPPWERFSPLSSPDHAVDARPFAGTRQWSAPLPVDETAGHAEDAEPTGCHTDGGLTVADLIAKLGGAPAQRPRHHHAAPETEPPVDVPAWPAQTDDERFEPVRSLAPRAPAAESEPEQTAVLPKASSRVPPRRIGTPSTAEDADAQPKRGRRPMLLAARCIAALMAVSALALTGGAWQWSASKNNRLNNISALDPHSRDVVDPNAQHGDENFLIVGVDSRAGANSQMGPATPRTPAARAPTPSCWSTSRRAVNGWSRCLFHATWRLPPCNARPGTQIPVLTVRSTTRKRDIRSQVRVHRDEAELGVRIRRPEVPGQGHPEAVRVVDQPLYRHRLRWVRQNGGRARRRGGVQQDPAERLRTGHGARACRTADHRRANRTELRARPPGHHRR
ncbi:hypothetical protein I552_2594 [Mycobacterium xenopi 3993]|nr:hypothetical protein I552_2594 [Mycobacterium xenopi 3993]